MADDSFLDDSPETPNPTFTSTPATPEDAKRVTELVSTDVVSLPTPGPEQHLINVQARVAAAENELSIAKRELSAAQVACLKSEPEMSLAERNADARRIQARIDDKHVKAVAALVEAGVDVKRVIKEGVKPRVPRKPASLIK